MKRGYLVLSLLVLSMLSYAKDDAGIVKSIEWQKVELQEKVARKVDLAVSSILDRKDFLVEVDISVLTPPTPNFDKRKAAGPRESDAEFEESSRDYIVFSELGLEAPVLGKAENEKQQYLKDLWKFNKSNDIFSNLDSATIFLYLDKKINQETVDSVKTILNNLKLPIGELTAEVEIEQINLSGNQIDPENVEAPLTTKDYIEYASRFSTMVGFLLSTILFVASAFWLFRKYRIMKENERAKEMISSANNQLDEENDAEGNETMIGGGFGGAEAGAMARIGIDRFQKFLDKSRVEAITIIKKWIKDQGENDKLALNALVKQLNNDQLFELFSELSTEEREDWKSVLKDKMSDDEILKANDFISSQVVESIIVPTMFQDQDLIDTLLNITPDQGARFVQENPSMGGILMNIVNSKFVADIMANLSKGEVDEVLKESLAFSQENTEGIFTSFKETLANYRVQRSQKPFIKRIIEVIPMAKANMEESLYKALSDDKEFDAMRDIAGRFFPSFLVENLSDRVLTEVIKQYPIKNKVELLSLDNSSFNVRMINLFAPEGSKARDHLDIEMQGIVDDLQAQRRITDQPGEIWSEFVDYVRSTIKSTKEFDHEVEAVVEKWISEAENANVHEVNFENNAEAEEENVEDIKLASGDE